MKRINQMEPHFGKEEKSEILDCLASGWLTESKKTKQFEEMIASFVCSKHALTVNNGTISLTLSLIALGIKPNDEVIVPDMTMVATANAVVLAGARPILVDVTRNNFTLDANQIEDKISKKTKAILPVAMNARAPEMKKIMAIAKKHKLVVIEDAAQALGSYYRGKHLGTIGNCGSISFSTPKIITTGQGGVVICNNIKLRNKIYQLKDFGRKERTSKDHNEIGWNFKFTDLQAALGIAQMRKLESRIVRKKEMYLRYEKELGGVEGIEMLETNLKETTPWFIDIYVQNPKKLKEYLFSKGIGTLEFYPALHTLKVHKQSGKFPNASWASQHGLWLPSSSFLTNSDIKRICREIKTYYKQRINNE